MLDVSVLIATRDRAVLLAQTLSHLARQQLEGLRWEVLVVDNGSRDATSQVLARTGRQLPLVALAEPKPGKNRALNRAVAAARGQLLIFADDDIIAPPHWVTALCGAAQRWPDDSIFGGQIAPLFPAGTPDWLAAPGFAYAGMAFGYYSLPVPEGPVDIAPFGANLALRRSLFATTCYCEAIGPQDGDYIMGSETELLLRLQSQGHRFIYVPAARVQHVVQPHQVTRRFLMKRAVRAGRSRARFGPQVTRRQLAGVPWYVWRELITASWSYAWNAPRGAAARCRTGMRFWKAFSAVSEYQRIRREHRDEEAVPWRHRQTGSGAPPAGVALTAGPHLPPDHASQSRCDAADTTRNGAPQPPRHRDDAC